MHSSVDNGGIFLRNGCVVSAFYEDDGTDKSGVGGGGITSDRECNSMAEGKG